MRTKPRLLILSFSNIASDARVMRQVDEFSDDYEITTCGYGPQPREEVRHIRLRSNGPKLLQHIQGLLLHLRLLLFAYLLTPEVADARKQLRAQRFDAVLANDLSAAGVASGVAASSKIHLDLHEYWLGLHDQDPQWRKLRIPYYSWMLRKYAVKFRSFTTVNDAIADRYLREFGISAEVVTNAGLFQDLEPQPVGDRLRFVHSGGVNTSRRIDVMMRAVAASSSGATFDLYLVGEGGPEHAKLVALSEELGEGIQIHSPVPQSQLVAVLNSYDVGIHVLAPTCTNNRLALPNKFFDFVQARVAMVTGPTEAMVGILDEYELGIVTESFAQEEITEAIDHLTAERVAEFKQNAHRAARVLAGEAQIPVWRRAIEAIAK